MLPKLPAWTRNGKNHTGSCWEPRGLEKGEIIVLNGHVLAIEPDAYDEQRVRLVLVRALGPPPGKTPDQREIELFCPRDMIFATAQPHNIELAPLPPR
jgi:hypothetical protein